MKRIAVTSALVAIGAASAIGAVTATADAAPPAPNCPDRTVSVTPGHTVHTGDLVTITGKGFMCSTLPKKPQSEVYVALVPSEQYATRDYTKLSVAADGTFTYKQTIHGAAGSVYKLDINGPLSQAAYIHDDHFLTVAAPGVTYESALPSPWPTASGAALPTAVPTAVPAGHVDAAGATGTTAATEAGIAALGAAGVALLGGGLAVGVRRRDSRSSHREHG